MRNTKRILFDSVKRKLLLLSLLFLIIPMNVMGFGSALVLFPFLLTWFTLTLLINEECALDYKVLVNLLLYVIFVAFVIIIIFIHNSSYYDLIRMVLYGLMLNIMSIMLCSIYRYNFYDFKYELVKGIYYCGSFNALIAVVVMVIPSSRGIIYSIVETSPANIYFLEQGIRSSGLFFFGGSTMSLFHFAIVYIGLFYLRIKYTKKIPLIKDYILDTIIISMNILAIVISGRMGFVLLIFMYLVILFLPEKYTKASKVIAKNTIILSAITISLLALFFYKQAKALLEWAFEMFINLLSGNSLKSESTEILAKMYYFPDNVIFGEGVFSQSFLKIDAGYMLMVWFFGFFMVLVFILLIISFLLNTINKNKSEYFAPFFLLITIIVVGNFKDNYLFGFNGLTQLFFITMYLCSFSDKSKLFK